MKSEHRHELKTNDLSRLLSEWGHALERFVRERTSLLVAAAVLLIAAGIGFIYWRSTTGAADSESWRELANATSAADLANIADKFAGTKVAAWARLREAERELGSGIRLLFTDRIAGNSDLKKAEESFEKVIADKSAPPEVIERALFGLATCRESFPDKSAKPSEIDDPAIQTYLRLTREFPESVYKGVAEERIAALKTGTAQDFYAWFERQNPKPADREMPQDLIPPEPEGPTTDKTSAGNGPSKSAPADVKLDGKAAKDKAPK